MKTLIQVDTFGAVDADNDDLLLECFEDHEAFTGVTDRSRFLVVGKKGSGKTAIFKRMLTTKRSNYFCFGHTFSDYPWHHHDLQARAGIPNFDKFTHSWKYLILLTASKIILNYDHSLPFDQVSMDLMVKVEKFIVDTYGTRDPDVTQIFTPSKTLKLKPHFDLDWKILKAGISPENVPMNELPAIVQELNSNLLDCAIKCLNPDNEYYICFDQLDLGFDPTSDDYKNRLIGLLLAARDINIAARNAKKNLFVAVFLRDDIYETLHFEDKNKITENFLSLIEWDTPRTNKTLKSLMEKRFKVVMGGNPTWNDVFDETKEMPGHQSKYQHILDRTYLRPRDIIKFTNSVLRQYQAREKGRSVSAGMFENIDLHNARTEYSGYLINELDDEIHKHLPHYEKLVELLRAIGVWQFTFADFEKQYDANSDFQQKETAKTILQELYEFSLIGFYRPGGRGYGGSEYVFKYKEPKTRFDPQAVRFRIHPGLIEVFGLKRFTVGAAEADSGDQGMEEILKSIKQE
ncbi:MAG: P-loop ATPase, Sll1717 family [Ferrovibrio sp.]|uniref:P-loop ATPase, Sll1717 family n=1 Tax=Ferrovibrio sp. TaxID=1917215 RepID=UPI00391B3E2F